MPATSALSFWNAAGEEPGGCGAPWSGSVAVS